jgi:hypothetical protein
LFENSVPARIKPVKRTEVIGTAEMGFFGILGGEMVNFPEKPLKWLFSQKKKFGYNWCLPLQYMQFTVQFKQNQACCSSNICKPTMSEIPN